MMDGPNNKKKNTHKNRQPNWMAVKDRLASSTHAQKNTKATRPARLLDFKKEKRQLLRVPPILTGARLFIYAGAGEEEEEENKSIRRCGAHLLPGSLSLACPFDLCRTRLMKKL